MRLISLHEDAVRALERLRVPFDDVTPEGLWASPYHLIGVTAEQRAVLDSWNLEVNDITPDVLTSADVAPQLKESWPQQRPRPVSDAAAEQRATSPRQPAPAFAADTSAAQPDRSSQRDSEVPVPMHEEPKHHGDPLGDAAAERAIVERAAAAAEARSDVAPAATNGASNGASNGAATAATAVRPRAANAPATSGKISSADTAPATDHAPKRLRVSIGGKYREASVQQGKILLDGQSFDNPAAATRSVAPSKGDWVFWEYFDDGAGKWRMLDRDWQPGQTS
ncbi:MAG TPA: hypothetical protein VN706_03930 [Gemmatimonadaceae bacterium]|nr:hypothetical protein [Gemmatimonadaceae bacterium]